jgi:protein-tyrosine phosphatase
MEQVSESLYISGIDAAGESEKLINNGITTVVKLTHAEPDGSYPDSIMVAEHPLIDGPQCEFESFRDAVDELVRLLAAEETILVHCSAGSSRSGAVVAAAVARSEDIDVTTALTEIQQQKTDVDPHSALLRHAQEMQENR